MADPTSDDVTKTVAGFGLSDGPERYDVGGVPPAPPTRSSGSVAGLLNADGSIPAPSAQAAGMPPLPASNSGARDAVAQMFPPQKDIYASIGAPQTGPTGGGLAYMLQAKSAEQPYFAAAMQSMIDAQKSKDTLFDTRTKPPKLEPFHAPKETGMWEKLGSPAMMLAGLGGILGRGHALRSLEAAAAVNTAIKNKDDKAYERAYNEWQAETKNTIQQYSWEHQSYDDAMKYMDSKPATAMAMLETAAHQFQDPMMLSAIQNGESAARSALNDKREWQLKLAEHSDAIQKNEDERKALIQFATDHPELRSKPEIEAAWAGHKKQLSDVRPLSMDAERAKAVEEAMAGDESRIETIKSLAADKADRGKALVNPAEPGKQYRESASGRIDELVDGDWVPSSVDPSQLRPVAPKTTGTGSKSSSVAAIAKEKTDEWADASGVSKTSPEWDAHFAGLLAKPHLIVSEAATEGKKEILRETQEWKSAESKVSRDWKSLERDKDREISKERIAAAQERALDQMTLANKRFDMDKETREKTAERLLQHEMRWESFKSQALDAAVKRDEPRRAYFEEQAKKLSSQREAFAEWTPEKVRGEAAKLYNDPKYPLPFGNGPYGNILRSQAGQMAAEMRINSNVTPQEQQGRQKEYGAVSQSYGKLYQLDAGTELFNNTFVNVLGAAREAVKKAALNSPKGLNAPINELRASMGADGVGRMDVLMQTVQGEFARVQSAGALSIAQTHAGSLENAMKSVNENYPVKAIMERFDAMQTDINAKRLGYKAELDKLSRILNGHDKPPPSSVTDNWVPGKVYRDSGGFDWKKNDDGTVTYSIPPVR